MTNIYNNYLFFKYTVDQSNNTKNCNLKNQKKYISALSNIKITEYLV